MTISTWLGVGRYTCHPIPVSKVDFMKGFEKLVNTHVLPILLVECFYDPLGHIKYMNV